MKKSCSVCLIVVLFVFLGLKVYAGDSWRSFHNFKSNKIQHRHGVYEK